MDRSSSGLRDVRSVAGVRALIYRVERREEGWFALGVPEGRPRLRCTWEVTEAEAEQMRSRLNGSPLQMRMGDPVRTVGVPERFEPTEGY